MVLELHWLNKASVISHSPKENHIYSLNILFHSFSRNLKIIIILLLVFFQGGFLKNGIIYFQFFNEK